MRKSFAFFLLCFSIKLVAQTPPPKLVVQLVVDQLRGDLVHRYSKGFGQDGFNYLLTHGIDFQNAHHPHAFTVTCVGHATIATGSYPSLHGIVANNWLDRESKKEVYCTDDENSPILPTSHTKGDLPGRSPHYLMASTLSDEIVLRRKGKAFAVSLKDRAAITLAGHAGKAFWFDRDNGGFITSKHYYDTYPIWVDNWNKKYTPERVLWTMTKNKPLYQQALSPIIKNKFPDFGKTFPHNTGNPDNPLYFKYLSMTPVADELTANFAAKLLVDESLGKTEGNTDYLAISFSAMDAIGHQFGPNSLESEDNMLRLDKTLSILFKTIDKEVGLKNTLFILTADHGVTDAPVYLKSNHMTQMPKADISSIETLIHTSLTKLFNLPEETLEGVALPYVYLNHQIINDQKLSVGDVSQRLAEVLSQDSSIFQAYPLPLRQDALDWLSKKIDKMNFATRTGDIYLVPPPFQSANDKSVRVDHGSPWNYDSYVPLVFANPLFKQQIISRPVRTTSIAPTLSSILQIKAPSAAVGKPLEEVIGFYNPRKSS